MIIKFEEKISIEAKPLENYYKAEAYHQNYLNKNPAGYFHIPVIKFDQANHIWVMFLQMGQKKQGTLFIFDVKCLISFHLNSHKLEFEISN